MANIRVGTPDTDIESPSHVDGVRQGNEEGSYDKQPGHYQDGTSDAQRSTGVEAKKRNPIDPRMPNLSPN